MRRRHRAGRHYSSLLRAGAIHAVREKRVPPGDLPAYTARRRAQRRGNRCSLREQAAALAASAYVGSKSTATADSRSGVAQGSTVPNRLFDATGAKRALEPVSRQWIRDRRAELEAALRVARTG